MYFSVFLYKVFPTLMITYKGGGGVGGWGSVSHSLELALAHNHASEGVNQGFCPTYKFSFLLWEIRMFPYESLVEICRLFSDYSRHPHSG